MKKLGLILLLCIAAFLGYLVWSYFAGSASNTLIVLPGQPGNQKPSSANDNTKSTQTDFLSYVKKQIDAAKKFVWEIPQDAANTFNNLIDNTKNTAKENLINILGPTSSTASSPGVSQSVAGNQQAANAGGSPGQNLSAEPHVCSIVSRGSLIGYGIDQPFINSQEVSYDIAWGDGQNAKGIFKNGDQSVTVSHSYSQTGTYSVTFQVISSSTSFTTSRSVCVK